MVVSEIHNFLENVCEFIFILIWIAIRTWQSKTSDSVRCLNGKTAIVTGGSMGIGFQACLMLASRGCKVIIADCCDSAKAVKKIVELTGNTNISSKKLDLGSLKSVREFAESIKRDEPKIDILINNAGVGSMRRKTTDDGLNTVMQINYFGHFLLTHLLKDLLKSSNGARIVFNTSSLSLFNDLTVENLNRTNFVASLTNAMEFYRNSKFALMLAAQEFAKRLGKFGISVNAADPGTSKTAIFEKSLNEQENLLSKSLHRLYNWLLGTTLAKTPWQAAQTSFHVATSDQLEGNGKVYLHCKTVPKMRILEDEQYCREIWEKTEELVQLAPEERL